MVTSIQGLLALISVKKSEFRSRLYHLRNLYGIGMLIGMKNILWTLAGLLALAVVGYGLYLFVLLCMSNLGLGG